jgi:hypothetical protein
MARPLARHVDPVDDTPHTYEWSEGDTSVTFFDALRHRLSPLGVLVLRCNTVDENGQKIVSHVIIDVLTGERLEIRRSPEQIRRATRYRSPSGPMLLNPSEQARLRHVAGRRRQQASARASRSLIQPRVDAKLYGRASRPRCSPSDCRPAG